MQEAREREEKYRVLLMGIEEDTEERREHFCRMISEKSSVPFPVWKEMLACCPVILRHSLSQEQAQRFAATLKEMGALVSVENGSEVPSVLLDFQDLGSAHIALEASHVLRTPSETWCVTGKVKNISAQGLEDVWVLVQLFEEHADFVTFEEVPIAINPLPPGKSSPFKAIFDGDLPVKSVSLAFKQSAGNPIPAVDHRRLRWFDVEIKEGREEESVALPSFDEEETTVLTSQGGTTYPDKSQPPSEGEEEIEAIELEDETEAGETDLPSFETASQEAEAEEIEPKGEPGSSLPPEPGLPRGEVDMIGIVFPELGQPSGRSKPKEEASGVSTPALEEASQLLRKISRLDEDPRDGVREPESARASDHRQAPKVEQATLPAFAWMEDFKQSVEAYYHTYPDQLTGWMDTCREKNGSSDRFHSLLTILVHSRFDQTTEPQKALENTKRVFQLLSKRNLRPEAIPALEGTRPFPADQWRVLFHRALPRIQEIAKDILSKGQWHAPDLERLIQVIPHMSARASRRAARRIHDMGIEGINIDFSRTSLLIENSIYRVAARLGVVDPQFDPYEGPNSMGDLKIQSFAKAAFPSDPPKVEEPMIWLGDGTEEGRNCTPTHPRCDGCLFATFCPRRCSNVDPSEKGLRDKNEKLLKRSEGRDGRIGRSP
jgi:hypothetical protein